MNSDTFVRLLAILFCFGCPASFVLAVLGVIVFLLFRSQQTTARAQPPSPVFGHTIDLMKENKDVTGLVSALSNKDPKVRVGAAEAIKEIGDEEAVTRLGEHLVRMLKYGTMPDQIEALALACGRVDDKFLAITLPEEERAKALEKVHGQLPLWTIANVSVNAFSDLKEVHPYVRWYHTLALVQCGKRDTQILKYLVDLSERIIRVLDEHKEDTTTTFTVTTVVLWMSIRRETLRAISYFRGIPEATEALVSASEGRLFGFHQDEYERRSTLRDEIYALGALGDSATCERLEYLATQGEEKVQKRARIALEYFGQATFDEIQSEVKTRFGIE